MEKRKYLKNKKGRFIRSLTPYLVRKFEIQEGTLRWVNIDRSVFQKSPEERKRLKWEKKKAIFENRLISY